MTLLMCVELPFLCYVTIPVILCWCDGLSIVIDIRVYIIFVVMYNVIVSDIIVHIVFVII